jgi:GNAT superfamily N-acetyltransferase
MHVRDGSDADAEGFIALIGACWSEYPGCILDVDGEVPELRALATYFAGQGGRLFAAGEDGAVLGMAATRPMGHDAAWEICKVYVAKAARGTGLAHRLLAAAEAHARAQGAQRLVLWTDTRFEAAHRFYEKRGFLRQGSIRILDDLSKSLEFRYAKPLTGLVVEALDAAAAASAERRLAELLVAGVADGAALGFRAPLVQAVAQGVWKQASADVALGRRLLLAAWLEGALAGTAQLRLDMPETAPHRAELSLLLVDPAQRRRGIGRALLRKAEQAAAGLGRRLLTATAPDPGPAAALLGAEGWQRAGAIPGHEAGPDGTPRNTAFLWKGLA